jgi:SAM-dependent methyltransferase
MGGKPPGFFEGTEMPSAGWWEALWPDPASVLTKVGITSGMDVIDLCSGDGWFTLQIAKLARHVVAIDIDPALLEVTRYRLTEAGLHNCDFVAGDAYDIARLSTRPVDFRIPGQRLPRRAGSAAPRPFGEGRLETLGTVRHRQLASAGARGDNRVGRATRAANGIANVAGTDHQGRGD